MIGALVGTAIHHLMFERTLELLRQPDAPNLYWAVSTLPRPMINFRRGFEAELSALYFSFPELRNLDQNGFPPEYWNRLLNKIYAELAVIGMSPAPSAENPGVFATALVLQGYPQARQWLIDRGRPVEEVDKMPVVQVVLLYTMRTFDELRDDLFKWMFLPYVEAQQGLRQAAEQLRNAQRQGREIIPLASLLVPAVGSVKAAEVRGERGAGRAASLGSAANACTRNTAACPRRLEKLQKSRCRSIRCAASRSSITARAR